MTPSLPNWTVNQPYSQTVVTTGGQAPVTFSVSAGSLPAGLTLNTTSGVISGTPTSAASSPVSFTLTTTDAVGNSNSETYGITINATPSITTTTLPNPAENESYVKSIDVNGGTAPDQFAIISGSIPPGLTLNTTTGVLSGVPTTINGNPFNFTIGVTDAAGATVSQSFTLTVFGVSSAVPTPTGVVLTFNAPINPGSTVLYSGPGSSALADITVVGAATGPVRGSLVIDATNPDVATFVQTSGLLAPDTYTVTVLSAVSLLGGDYSRSLLHEHVHGDRRGHAGIVSTEFRSRPRPVGGLD